MAGKTMTNSETKAVNMVSVTQADSVSDFGSGAYSKEHLEHTIRLFQPYSSAPLSYDDAREIVTNVLQLYKSLKRL